MRKRRSSQAQKNSSEIHKDKKIKKIFMKKKEPRIPSERHETIRQKILSLLNDQTLSAKELSGLVSVSERDVYTHLEHIQKTLNKKEMKLLVTPAQCRKCGFEFRKREKLKKPGKCPICHNESILEPRFSLQRHE
jgi:predicted Zn-ribbon and HTH transcriptional regulator